MLLFWPVVLGQTLVTSAQNCPAAAAVDARVREMLGLRTTDALEERATVERDGSSLRVTLRSKDERVLGDRLLRADGSCDELAGVVAVVLATWLSDVHPEYVGSLPEPAPPVSPAVPAPAIEGVNERRPATSASARRSARVSRLARRHRWLRWESASCPNDRGSAPPPPRR